MLRGADGRAIGVGDVVLVERAEGVDGGRTRCSSRTLARGEETLVDLVEPATVRSRSRPLGRLARLTEGEARPPGEIGDTGGAVSVDVADEQLGERVIGRDVLTDVIFHEHEALLAGEAGPGDDRPLADQTVDREGEQQMDAALARGVDVDALEDVEHLGAGASAVAERRRQRPDARGDHVVIDAEIAVAGGRLLSLPPRGDLQHPAEVARRDGVQGAAHGPPAHDVTAVEGAVDVAHRGLPSGADGQSPATRGEVLALHREHVARRIRHRGSRRDEAVRLEAVRSEALGTQSRGLHDLIMPGAADAAHEEPQLCSVTSRRSGSTIGCEPAMTSSTRITWHE